MQLAAEMADPEYREVNLPLHSLGTSFIDAIFAKHS
jgi:hypothetical protein